MTLSPDSARFGEMLAEAGTWPGIFAVRGWVNKGNSRSRRHHEADSCRDIRRSMSSRPFSGLVALIKTEVVTESELA